MPVAFLMRILFLTPRFYPCPGGYETYVYHLAETFTRGGHQVSVFTTDALDLEYFWVKGPRSFGAGRELHAGIEVCRFPICHRRWLRRAGRLLSLLPWSDLKLQFARPSFRVIGLRAALKQAPADVIHVGPLPYNHLMYYGVREGERRGIRVIAMPCTHFGEDTNDDVSRFYTQPYQIALLNRCHTVLALTEMERQRLVQLGVSAERIAVIGGGIKPAEITGGDAERFRSKWAIRGPIVLHLGMKAPDKGSVAVVEAMKLLWSEGSSAWLVLAGPSLSSFDEYLRPQASKLKQLLNLPPVSEEEKRDLLAAADIVVQPSRVESLGLIYLEAWANAKPVIAADTAVTRELIRPGEDGLLVPFGEPASLAAAIRELLNNPKNGRALGRRGQLKIRGRFSWDAVLERVSPYFLPNGAGSSDPRSLP